MGAKTKEITGISVAGEDKSMTISKLCEVMYKLVKVPATTDVWIVGELSDFSVRNGHGYADIVEKDEDGKAVAKLPLRVWSYRLVTIQNKFREGTNQELKGGLKVRVRVTPSLHKLYGLSVVADDIDPAYTMGDVLRRRQEIIDRLTREGVIEMNRSIEWTDVPTRIAIISSPNAAGYGDFCNQLILNQSRIKYDVRLFEAIMQGDNACPSIIAALERIAAEADRWDAVVIIRGGGASLDLQCFDNYDLAAAVAQFPLPVVVGIGHERDVTVLDYIANKSVKTPTAAAELFIKRGESLLNRLNLIAGNLLQRATDLMAAERQRLSYYNGVIATYPINAVRNANMRLSNSISSLSNVTARRIIPAIEKINAMGTQIGYAAQSVVSRQHDKMSACEQLLKALSPQAVLSRGYSVTRCNGHILTDAATVPDGAEVTTQLASGEIVSIVKK